MGLSLRDLAERSGSAPRCSRRWSAAETSPTLAIAAKVAAGLDLTLSQLLRLDEGSHALVSRESKRRRYKHGGHQYEELTPPLPGQRADVSLHVLSRRRRPGAQATRRSTSPAVARRLSS